MSARLRLVLSAVFASLLASGAAGPAAQAEPARIEAQLEPYLARYELPGLAAAVVRDGKIVALGATGTRRYGTDRPVTLEDRFHLGSNTKAMTATLAAILVERGKLRWTSTLGDIFPELAGTMKADLREVTIEQLLSHTGGIPADGEAVEKLFLQTDTLGPLNLDEIRAWLVQQTAALPLAEPPGRRFLYSNLGYVLAGAMLERVTGRSWEELIVDELFAPLNLRNAGLGPQSSLGRIDAPIGHWPRDREPPKPMLAGPSGDNPAVLGPAGTAHMSVLDNAAWAAWNAGLGRRGPALVSAETLRKVHTPVIDMDLKLGPTPGAPTTGAYGLGWATITLPISSEPFVFHGGSNQMNLANVFLQPSRDFAMVILTNVGGAKAADALRDLSTELYRQYGPAPAR